MQNNENEVVYLYLDDIIPNRFQPRQVFDEKSLKELAVSIKEHGVIQPIIVRNIGNKYEIIAGERRYKASALAGLTKIPAIVRNLDDKESSKVALLENLQRKNLNPIEEARTYQKILELDQMTQEELAKTMGKSKSAVANKLRLLSLPEEVQDALLKDQISERHARALLSVPDKEKQKELLKEIIDKKMTVRELEEKINQKPTVSTEEMEQLLKTKAVPVNEPETKVSSSNTSTTSIPASTSSEFNQSVGIDYSTPPKFIDYGEDVPKTIDSDLTSTASMPINLDEMKATAQDIPQSIPKNVNTDDLLKGTTESKSSDDNSSTSSSSDPSPSTFRFFQPLDDKEEERQENKPNNQEGSNINANIIPTLGITADDFTPSKKEMESSTPTSMDTLLAGVGKTPPVVDSSLTAPSSKEEDKIPYLDTYSNPFAHNPIFADDVQKLEGIKQQTVEAKPHYDLNESIELIRNTVKDIEASGFKVDIEEMDFEKNYQIVIKITKEKES